MLRDEGEVVLLVVEVVVSSDVVVVGTDSVLADVVVDIVVDALVDVVVVVVVVVSVVVVVVGESASAAAATPVAKRSAAPTPAISFLNGMKQPMVANPAALRVGCRCLVLPHAVPRAEG